MAQTINLFMWGYQPQFRFNLEWRAKSVLGCVAEGIEPEALLIGVRVPGSADPNEVCLEPEDGRWAPSLFAEVGALTTSILEDHPQKNLMFGDAPSMQDKPENLRRDSVRRAVVSVLDALDATSFVGAAQRVGEFHVVPVLLLPPGTLGRVPRLEAPIRYDRWSAPQSLFDAVAQQVVNEASEALTRPQPGRFEDFDTDVPSALRAAGKRFCQNLTLLTKDFMFQGLFEQLNVISMLNYEGAANAGSITFAPPDGDPVRTTLSFTTATPLSDARLVRKLLEISSRELSCICRGGKGILGLGNVEAGHEPNVFTARFTGHYQWDLVHNGRVLMRTEYGVPTVPRERLTRDDFGTWIARLFPGIRADAVARLWDIVDQATLQAHGTMIVVSESAQDEAVRLATQAIPVAPVLLTRGMVERISRIDGAILVDTSGTCYAVGVILDGLATPSGDPSRGARFNSAIRYTSTVEHPAACLVVSEDGYVDPLPRLMPLVRASEIAAKLNELSRATIENYHKSVNWLSAHRDYLEAAQCVRVNADIARIQSVPPKPREIRLIHQEFTVSPAFSHECIVDDIVPLEPPREGASGDHGGSAEPVEPARESAPSAAATGGEPAAPENPATVEPSGASNSDAPRDDNLSTEDATSPDKNAG